MDIKDVKSIFELEFTPEFIKDYQKIVKRHKALIKSFEKALKLLVAPITIF